MRQQDTQPIALLLIFLLGSLCLKIELKAEEQYSMQNDHSSYQSAKAITTEGGLPTEEKEKKTNDLNAPPNEPLKSEEDKSSKKEGKSEKGEKTEKTSPHKLTGSVTFVSDYRSRGISQSMRRPAVQGELKYTHISGFYFKSWASNVDGTGHFLNNTSMEWDFYLGIERPLWKAPLKYDVGFEYYYYPGGQAPVPRQVSYDFIEYYFGVGYKGFNIRIFLTLDDYSGVNSNNPPTNWDTGRPIAPNGHSQFSPYVEANYEWSPYPKWKASLHIGYQGVTNYPQLNYTDWQVGLSYQFAWFDVSFYYVATNARRAFYDVPDNAFRPKRRHLGAPGWVLGITRSF